MADNMSEVLQELSGLLDRITERNDASWKRKAKFRLPTSVQRQGGFEMNEMRSNANNASETLERGQEEDRQFRRHLLETLDQHNRLLETLIARLKDNPKKGPL